MHRLLRGRPRDEQGAVAILVGTMLVALLVLVGLVLDFGLARVDRQIDKSAADSAALAGAHGLNLGDGTPHSYAGVCSAIRYLKQNDRRFGSLTTTTGWTNGNGIATASGCTDSSLISTQCKGSDKTTWAVWKGSTTYQGVTLYVTIQGGYVLPSASNPSNWPEDNLTPSLNDPGGASYAGCDQLAVTVSQARKPGFGSLATSADLATAVRSVARVQSAPGNTAPALLLLKQTGCSVLTAGASGGGSKIQILGSVSADGVNSAPGTIHSDSDGVGCASNENIFTGQAAAGIEAYAAPLVSNPASADTTKPGLISAYAAALGAPELKLRDSQTNVCGSSGIYPTGTCPGGAVMARGRVYRKPVDERYLAGVQGVRDAANVVFDQLGTNPPSTLPAAWSALGYKKIDCNDTQSTINGLNLTSTSTVYVYCPSNSSFTSAVEIKAGTVIFAGKGVAPSGTLSMPNATKVYINGPPGGSGDAISLGNNTTFSMHTASNTTGTPAQCKDTATNSVNKAVLVIKYRGITQSNGLLQLCYTTVVMMGGQANACMPSAPSTSAPNTVSPCGGGTGFGQLTQTGGNVDWTAPNRYSVMTLSDGSTDPAKAGEYTDANGPEDLALWSESAGTSSNPKYQMTGGGSVHLVGVLMTPNAQPFNLSGQFQQQLVNAQYVAGSLALSSNNTLLRMSVDPNAAVTLPDQGVVGLVR